MVRRRTGAGEMPNAQGNGVKNPSCTSNREFSCREHIVVDRATRRGVGTSRIASPSVWALGRKACIMLENLSRTLSALSRRTVAIGALTCALAVACLGGCTQTTASDGGSGASDAAVVADTGSAAAPAADDAQIAVQVVVDSSAADGSVTYDDTVELDEGATVLDAIKATGLELDIQDSDYGSFVNGIGGLASFDFGDSSGWGYDLNGETVMDSADVATVSDGDVLTWTYLV